jgi:hypothetical protein
MVESGDRLIEHHEHTLGSEVGHVAPPDSA